jgi:alpha-glucosidase
MIQRESPPRLEWWKCCPIYQICPCSFQDSNGDGVGDIPGILSRLDHLSSLGVGAIWLSPIYRSPMLDFGYDIADYTEVDPGFGTIDDFDRLVQRFRISAFMDQAAVSIW